MDVRSWTRESGFGQGTWPWPRAVRGACLWLPLWDVDGRPVGGRARPLDDKPYALAGSHIEVPYGATAMLTDDVLHVAEGEVDTETLREAGAAHVVGIPGASTWRAQWTRWIWDADPRRVVLWLDADGAGIAGTRKLRASLDRRIETWTQRLPPGADVNDVWLADSDALRAAIYNAETE